MSTDQPPLVPRRYLLPFALVTTLFALWGFANDITNPLVAAFRDVFVISNAQSAWIQTTIYGIALDGMGDEAKIASAGLIFAIVGGALMPPLQGRLIDLGGESGLIFGLSSVSFSFVLPLACFLVIGLYALRSTRIGDVDPRRSPQLP